MGSLFGSKQKTTSSTAPYSGTYKSQAADYYNLVKQQVNTPATAYSGTLNATTNDSQTNATNNINNLTNTQALTDTINGTYLDPSSNPYLQKYYDQAASNVNKSYGEQYDTIDSKFGSNSFYGGSQHQKAMQNMANNEQQTLSDLATNIYGNAYTTERANQMNAISQSNDLNNSLYNVGQQQYSNEQDSLTNTYNEWLRQQNQDQSDLDRYAQYLSLVKNPSQSQTTSSSPGLGTVAMSMFK